MSQRSDRAILMTARIISGLFRPQYLPVVGFFLLFRYTVYNVFPPSVKRAALILVFGGTVLLPYLSIRLWRGMNGWEPHHLRHQDKRFVPYLINIFCYVMTLYLLHRVHMPMFMSGILIGALLIQVSCAFVNIWWKISTHSAGAGGIIGAIIAYSLLFEFNPLFWLAVAFFIAGIVCSCRMLLRQHSLGQVCCGVLVGAVGGFVGINYAHKILEFITI